MAGTGTAGSVHVQKITVPFEFPVCFTTDVFAVANPFLVDALSRQEPLRRQRLLLVVERAVADAWPRLLADIDAYVAHHAERLEMIDAPLVVNGGEGVKNDASAVAALQARMDALRVDRQSHVVVVGGGALLDMVGYVAGIVHRGVRVTRVPTTVLAQADSGVGVKNGINAFGKKNFLGTFAPPFAVLNDDRFFETLGRRDTVAGMAEAVKVALIRDPEFFAWLCAHADALSACQPAPLQHLVRRAAQLHLDHIATSGDPFEMGSARPLDFGHWAAHKLESLSGHRLRHGEAVAIGVALDTVYSVRTGLLAPAALEPILSLFERLGLRLWDAALEAGPAGRPTVLDGLEEFREHLGGELTVTLLRSIGRGVEVHDMREEVVVTALAELRRRDAGR
jgi:3-dehydroquinate synthase